MPPLRRQHVVHMDLVKHIMNTPYIKATHRKNSQDYTKLVKSLRASSINQLTKMLGNFKNKAVPKSIATGEPKSGTYWNKKTWYEVKKGDTLSAIAKRNNTTVASLMSLNKGKVDDKDVIRTGQVINIGRPKEAKAKQKSVESMQKAAQKDFATTLAEAKRRGLKTFMKGKTELAAVTKDDLKKAGVSSLREYLNLKNKKKKKK